ncbi:MAG: energy transducer TonB [Opitutaceae bacterium]
MKNSLFPIPLRFRSVFVCLTTPVRFSALILLCFLSASAFADAPNPQSVAQNNAAPPVRFGGISGGVEVFDIKNLDRIPEVKFRTDVQYPFEMRRAGKTGEVIVEFIVDTNGNVIDAFAVRSNQREFEANAVASVKKWKFKPGQKSGRNVNTRMQVPILFTLNER